jgi:hypothetical protein
MPNLLVWDQYRCKVFILTRNTYLTQVSHIIYTWKPGHFEWFSTIEDASGAQRGEQILRLKIISRSGIIQLTIEGLDTHSFVAHSTWPDLLIFRKGLDYSLRYCFQQSGSESAPSSLRSIFESAALLQKSLDLTIVLYITQCPIKSARAHSLHAFET